VSIGVASALAQLDRPSIRAQRVIDASLLEIDMRDRRQVKGLWNGQEVCQCDFVASMQAESASPTTAYLMMKTRMFGCRGYVLAARVVIAREPKR
jgi:hypothetical protein